MMGKDQYITSPHALLPRFMTSARRLYDVCTTPLFALPLLPISIGPVLYGQLWPLARSCPPSAKTVLPICKQLGARDEEL